MNERDWIPCHRRLLKGAKKSWPRAARFVFLELCHEARPTGGVIDLPIEWDTLTAVHDRIGGNRKEIRVALALLQIPDATQSQVVQIERDETQHRLEITKWDSWVGPKSGAERMQTLRERVLKNANASRAPLTVTPTGEESKRQERRGESAAPLREEAPSQIRIRSAPPPPPSAEPPDPDWAGPKRKAIAAKIHAHACFAQLDAEAIADEYLGHLLTTGQKLEWALRAIAECAGKVAGLGLAREALQGKLVGFMRHGKADPETKPPGMTYRELKPDKATPIDVAKHAELAARVASLGRGGNGA